jgi:hypothetical protein
VVVAHRVVTRTWCEHATADADLVAGIAVVVGRFRLTWCRLGRWLTAVVRIRLRVRKLGPDAALAGHRVAAVLADLGGGRVGEESAQDEDEDRHDAGRQAST